MRIIDLSAPIASTPPDAPPLMRVEIDVSLGMVYCGCCQNVEGVRCALATRITTDSADLRRTLSEVENMQRSLGLRRDRCICDVESKKLECRLRNRMLVGMEQSALIRSIRGDPR